MKRLNKKLIAFFAVALCFFVLSAQDNDSRTFFVDKKVFSVYPIDSSIGQTVSPYSTDNHSVLYEALSKAYDFDWTEKYINEQMRKSITAVYSTLLSEILPCKNVLFSREHRNADESITISVKLQDSGKVISFVLLNNRIQGISAD